MALLAEPMEYLDLAHGDAVHIQITDYEVGEASIAPKNPTPRHVAIHMQQNSLSTAPAAGHPITVNVPVLRVFVRRLDDPSKVYQHGQPPKYYDISSKTLQAALLPLLKAGVQNGRTFKISANGHAPQKRYSLEVL